MVGNLLAMHVSLAVGWPSGKSVCLGSSRLGFHSSSGQTNDFKIGIHSFLAWRSALKGLCEEQAGKFTCYAVGERHLAGFLHLGVVDKWLATPKRARMEIAHSLLSRDRRINMPQNTKIQHISNTALVSSLCLLGNFYCSCDYILYIREANLLQDHNQQAIARCSG